MARCLLQPKDMPTNFWAEAIYCANYLLNRISTREVSRVTPIEKQCGKDLSIGHLKTFGCVSWAHISYYCRNKLDAKNCASIMMRYSKDSKSYRLFDPIKQQIIIRCNVIFYENTSSIGLLNSSSGPSYNDSFGIVEDIRSTVPLLSTLTSLSTSFLESIVSRDTTNKTVTSSNYSSNGNVTSPTPCLPQWDVKVIEIVALMLVTSRQANIFAVISSSQLVLL